VKVPLTSVSGKMKHEDPESITAVSDVLLLAGAKVNSSTSPYFSDSTGTP
jgi:hypothetical protein